MCKRLRLGLAVAAVAGVALAWHLRPRLPARGPTFRGLTAAHWEAELRGWDFTEKKPRHFSFVGFWTRRPSRWVEWLGKVGIDAEGPAAFQARWQEELPLFEGDPDVLVVPPRRLGGSGRRRRLPAGQGGNCQAISSTANRPARLAGLGVAPAAVPAWGWSLQGGKGPAGPDGPRPADVPRRKQHPRSGNGITPSRET
jgi:hypothetical protein